MPRQAQLAKARSFSPQRATITAYETLPGTARDLVDDRVFFEVVREGAGSHQHTDLADFVAVGAVRHDAHLRGVARRGSAEHLVPVVAIRVDGRDAIVQE